MKKIVSAVLSVFYTAALLCSCGTSKTADDASEPTLTMWMSPNSIITSTVSNFGDLPIAKELEKQTGIKVIYMHPGKEYPASLDILLESGIVPDMVYNTGDSYQFGSVNDKFAKLNDLIRQYSPNLQKLLEENEEFANYSSSVNGELYMYPFLREDKSMFTYSGFIIRKDFLDKLGLDVPETIDDWENMLRHFKNELHLPSPFCGNFHNAAVFATAFGTVKDFYLDYDNKIKCGFIEPAYKEFLTLMRRWYSEGLVNKNFYEPIAEKMLNDECGSAYGPAGSSMNNWRTLSKNPDFVLTGAKYPVLNRGDKPEFGQRITNFEGSVSILKRSINKELAAEYLDFGYSEKGHMLYNFGIENESYVMKDGYPEYTDVIYNNPNGYSITQSLGLYTMSCYSGPFVQDKRYVEQYYTRPEEHEAIELWNQTNAWKHFIPLAVRYNDKAGYSASYMDIISNYVYDMSMRFITGVEPIENFDAYVNQIKAYGIDKIIAIQQEAMDAYLSK